PRPVAFIAITKFFALPAALVILLHTLEAAPATAFFRPPSNELALDTAPLTDEVIAPVMPLHAQEASDFKPFHVE
ncbi:hypothetical protein, partial [Lysinibacillus sp. D3C2_S12]|uniref:hypothetical protein n=1 Tax=Lysinibacillus sp. D3C2_S12 TaxID=2941226 RepID=UPI0020C16CFE